MTFYVVIQKGICIFGAGITKEEALDQACEWTDTKITDLVYSESYNSADEDSFVLIECTERLYSEICLKGSVLYTVDNNIADIDID